MSMTLQQRIEEKAQPIRTWLVSDVATVSIFWLTF
jgi:hypothetical protein